MTAFRRRPDRKNWLRFALKLGLLATDATVVSAIARMLTEPRDREEVLRPRQRLSEDLAGRHGWSHTSTLLVGVGIGVGLGLVFAPAPGDRTRRAIRDKVLDIRERVTGAALWADRSSASAMSKPSTGTYAE